jgi:2Fe-2S ferredoxin
MPKMTFINPDGSRLEVEAPVGLSVLEIAHRNNISLEGACEGSLLGCQIKMTEELDGLTVSLPTATRNMMVDK